MKVTEFQWQGDDTFRAIGLGLRPHGGRASDPVVHVRNYHACAMTMMMPRRDDSPASEPRISMVGKYAGTAASDLLPQSPVPVAS